ncbi:MAG: hypothetical protein UW86_C0029G0003 [Microgenomates group bacterium GW2011_GWA1_Microgenomates_45_10]|nr:MAG: hypothetical protein UW86_C0029G0003 [Microgenomates group bacterium GW2011_GWA1_Microgenomates_45_10]
MANEVVVIMPPAEEMVKKLADVGLYGKEEAQDRFLRSFVEKVAGSEKVGPGLVMAWMLSEYDVLRDYPPVISGLMRYHFDEVVDAVTQDVRVAVEAKAFLKKVLEETKKK